LKNQSLLFIFAAFTISYTYAAPDDLFLQATPAKNKLTTNASLDIVNDTVDFLDLRESEGVKGDSGDYLGGHISSQYQLHPEWAINADYWRREIEFGKDTNKLNSGALGLTYFPASLSTDRSNLAFKLSFWGNQADEVAKTSPTNINGRTINEVMVSNPRDTQLQLDTIYTHKIDFMNQVNIFGSLGYSKVKVDELDLIVRLTGDRRDCTANINIDSNNNLSATPIGRCLIDGLIVRDIDIGNYADQFDLDVKKDLNYDSYYASLGGSWNWRYRQFESQLAYQYQRLWRKDIDDRISNFGNSPIKDNHTFGAKFSYDFTPKLTGYLQGQLFQNNLVGYVPFLYNGVTASRLDKRYGLASIGIQYHGF
jgi:hypothetical protein